MMMYLLISVFLLSLVLTAVVRRYALAKNIIDSPNHRSSHVVPTPRGGGVAFIIVFLGFIPCLAYFGCVHLPVEMALVGAGFIVAALGFFDDHGHIPARFRIVGHFIAALFVLYCLGGMPSVSLLGWVVPAGLFLNGLAVIYLVWLLNLYNFMDGIDGLAAVEAISVCLGGVVLYGLNGDLTLIWLPLFLASAVAGFLWWNFPPARIFMGDAGSGFLGLVLGVLSLQAAGIQSQLFWGWLILLGVFIVDATLTLLSRLVQGLKVYEAHCDHAYQHAVRRVGCHGWVTSRVLLINIFWLLPLAVLVGQSFLNGFVGLFIAYFPLVLVAIKFKKIVLK